MTRTGELCHFLTLLVLCCSAWSRASADTETFTGVFTADDSLFNYSFTTTTSQVFDFYTTSYGGGMNANGTVSVAGGFDPVLTLFSNSSGMVLGFGGSSGMCEGASNADPGTGLCEDASFYGDAGAGELHADPFGVSECSDRGPLGRISVCGRCDDHGRCVRGFGRNVSTERPGAMRAARCGLCREPHLDERGAGACDVASGAAGSCRTGACGTTAVCVKD